LRVVVFFAVHDGGVLDEVEHEYKDHECWSNEDPAGIPIPIDTESDHQFNTVVHFFASEKPTNGDGLEKDTPEKRHSTRGVKIHQLEDVNSTL
jgi:hypothetical protein